MAFVPNTGRVGGGVGNPDSKQGSILDFGCEAAASVPGVDDIEIPQPGGFTSEQAERVNTTPWRNASSASGPNSRLLPGPRFPGCQVSGLNRPPSGTSVVNRSVPFVGYVCVSVCLDWHHGVDTGRPKHGIS
jgi:hypothetical protein